MSKNWVLTPDLFDDLLDWFEPNREAAGEKYEHIRRALIKIFVSNGSTPAEDLADEAINRVARKLPQIRGDYEGDPALYFYGVAKKMVHEQHRRPAVHVPPPAWDADDDFEPEFECLERCLEELTAQNRELVLQYYQEDKQAKIDNRRKLADKLDITVNALRIRALRIRTSLELCVRTCVMKMMNEMN